MVNRRRVIRQRLPVRSRSQALPHHAERSPTPTTIDTPHSPREELPPLVPPPPQTIEDLLAESPPALSLPPANPPTENLRAIKEYNTRTGTIPVYFNSNHDVATVKMNAFSQNISNMPFHITPEDHIANRVDNDIGSDELWELCDKAKTLQRERPQALLSVKVEAKYVFEGIPTPQTKSTLIHFRLSDITSDSVTDILDYIAKFYPRTGVAGTEIGSDNFRTSGDFVRTEIKIKGCYVPLLTNSATYHFKTNEYGENILFGFDEIYTPFNADLYCKFRIAMHGRYSIKDNNDISVSPNWQEKAVELLSASNNNIGECINRLKRSSIGKLLSMYNHYVSGIKMEEQSLHNFSNFLALVLEYDYISSLIDKSDLLITPFTVNEVNEKLISIHAPNVKIHEYSIESLTKNTKTSSSHDNINIYNYDGHAFQVPYFDPKFASRIVKLFTVDNTTYIDRNSGNVDVRFYEDSLFSSMKQIPSSSYSKSKRGKYPFIDANTWVVAFDCETSKCKPAHKVKGQKSYTVRPELVQFSLAKVVRTEKNDIHFVNYIDDIKPVANGLKNVRKSSVFSSRCGNMNVSPTVAFLSRDVNMEHLFNTISGIVGEKATIYFFAHNGVKFDFPLMCKSLRRSQYKLEKLEGQHGEFPVYTHKNNNKTKFIFRDSYKITMMSLDTFAKSMGLPSELCKLDLKDEFRKILGKYENIPEYLKGSPFEIMNFIWQHPTEALDPISVELMRVFIRYSELDVISLINSLRAITGLFWHMDEGALKPLLALKLISGASSVTNLKRDLFEKFNVTAYSSSSWFNVGNANAPGGRVATNTFGMEHNLPHGMSESDINKYEQEALKELYKNKHKRLFYADVTSLYPASMFFFKYPTSEVNELEERKHAIKILRDVMKRVEEKPEDGFKLIDKFIFNSDYFYIIQLRYNGGSGIFSCMPLKEKVEESGKIITACDHRIIHFEEGWSQQVIRTHIEMLSFLAFNRGSIAPFEDDDVMVWNTDYVFAETVSQLYDMRAAYKKDKNPMEMVVKTIMNSLYGKTLQAPQPTVFSLKKPPGAFTKIGEKKYAGQTVNIWYNAEYQQHSVQVAMAVLAYSKYYVNRIIDCLGGAPGNIYREEYPMFVGDTDSFLVYEDHLDASREYLRQFTYACYKNGKYVLDKMNSDLGAVHYDKSLDGVATEDIQIARLAVVARKTYLVGLLGPSMKNPEEMVYHESVTAKGIPKKIIDDDFKINFSKYTEIGKKQYPKLHNTTFKQLAVNGEGGLVEEEMDRSFPQISAIYEDRHVPIHKSMVDSPDLNKNRSMLMSIGEPVYLKNKHILVSREIYEKERRKLRPVYLYHLEEPEGI